MSKTQYPPPQIVPVQTNATTASPNVVKAITLDPAYEMKTVQVVLTPAATSLLSKGARPYAL